MPLQFKWNATATSISNLKSGIFYKAINKYETEYIIFIKTNGIYRKITEIMHDGHDGIFYSGHKNIGLEEITYSQLVDKIYGWVIKEMTTEDFANLIHLGVKI